MPRPRDWYPDTDPKTLQVFIDLQRKMTPAEKIEAVFQTNELVWGMAEARERQLNPNAEEREIFLRLAARHLDRETMMRVYGWYPPDRTG